MPGSDRSAFLARIAGGEAGADLAVNLLPLWKRWPADLETPLTPWLKVGALSSHGVLLESVDGQSLGCTAFGADPGVFWDCEAGS